LWIGRGVSVEVAGYDVCYQELILRVMVGVARLGYFSEDLLLRVVYRKGLVMRVEKVVGCNV
jgi:hypothetical protein